MQSTTKVYIDPATQARRPGEIEDTPALVEYKIITIVN